MMRVEIPEEVVKTIADCVANAALSGYERGFINNISHPRNIALHNRRYRMTEAQRDFLHVVHAKYCRGCSEREAVMPEMRTGRDEGKVELSDCTVITAAQYLAATDADKSFFKVRLAVDGAPTLYFRRAAAAFDHLTLSGKAGVVEHLTPVPTWVRLEEPKSEQPPAENDE